MTMKKVSGDLAKTENIWIGSWASGKALTYCTEMWRSGRKMQRCI